MRFLGRSLIGVFLLALTLGLFAVAVNIDLGRAADPLGATSRRPVARARTGLRRQRDRGRRPKRSPRSETFGEVQSRRTLELRAAAGGRGRRTCRRASRMAARSTAGAAAPADRPGRPRNRPATPPPPTCARPRPTCADARAALELARDELAAAEAQAELRDRALDRQDDLLDRGVGTDAAVETAELAAPPHGRRCCRGARRWRRPRRASTRRAPRSTAAASRWPRPNGALPTPRSSPTSTASSPT